MIEGQSDEAVGLFHIAGDLGEVAIGGEADGAAQHGTDLVADGRLDSKAEVQRRPQGPLAAHEAAGHLVDGEDGSDGEAAFDGFDDAVVVVDVDLVAGLDEDDLGAHAFGVANEGAGADAEGLGLVAGGDAAGGVGKHGHNGDGPAAQIGADLLLDRGEVGVEIDEEPVEAGAGIGLGRRSEGGVRLEGDRDLIRRRIGKRVGVRRDLQVGERVRI